MFSSLVRSAVRDSKGRIIGRIEDLVLDPDSGRVSHLQILLSPPGNGFAGWITVPWSVVRIRPDSDSIVEIAARSDTLLKLAQQAP